MSANVAARAVWRKAILGGLVALCIAMMAWVGSESDADGQGYSFRGSKYDYYSQLVHGFIGGHFSLPITRDLYPTANSDGTISDRRSAPLDTSFYHGRVYLYYGVVPAALVLWPYRCLTGQDLALNVPTLGFTVIGFLTSIVWYFKLKRRWFWRASLSTDSAAVLMLAFGTATLFLVRRSMFYELPLAGGYAFSSIALWALTRALLAPEKPRAWIALASFGVGFATGCHPNYVFLTPLLAAVAWWISRDRAERLNKHAKGELSKLVLAAVLPAAAIGVGLAYYNFARFHDPFEFGFNYGQNEFFFSHDKLRSLAFILPNLHWYYFSPPSVSPYFPFFFPVRASFRPPGYHGIEDIHGQFVVTILLIWIYLGVAWWIRRLPSMLQQRRILIIFAWAAGASAAFILIMGIRANRYLVDFQAPLIGIAVLSAAAVSHHASPGKWRRGWTIALLALSVAAAAVNIGASLQQFDTFLYTRPQAFAKLSRWLNPTWAIWQKLGLVHSGVLNLDVVFKPHKDVVFEPLVTTGLPMYNDSVYAAEYPDGHIKFFLDHAGRGGPWGETFLFEPNKKYHLKIELGSFFPPRTDPFFAKWDLQSVRHLKSRFLVRMDGTPMIDRQTPIYDSAPWNYLIGSNHLTLNLFSTDFSGEISNLRWTSDVDMDAHAGTAWNAALVSLKLSFPETMPVAGQPLLMAGHAGMGSLLLMMPIAPGTWKFDVDQWGHALISGPTVKIPPGEHLIDLLIGPAAAVDAHVENAGLVPAFDLLKNELIVWIDGQRVARLQLEFYQNDFRTATICANTEGFSSAQEQFYGEIQRIYPTPLQVSDRLRQALK